MDCTRSDRIPEVHLIVGYLVVRYCDLGDPDVW